MTNNKLPENLGTGKIEQLTTGVINFKSEPSSFWFHTAEAGEILRFDPNGDIFVKGKLIENDKEVVDTLREFLKLGVKNDKN